MDGGAWWAAVHGVAKNRTLTEQLHFHFSLSCIGEGNGNPLQCSCLENPRDGGAWWAAVYRVAQSWTRLKGLSSSSMHNTGLPWWFSSKESAHTAGDQGSIPGRYGFSLSVGKIPWRRAWQPIPVFLLGKSPWTEEPGWATVPRVTKSRTQLSKFTFFSFFQKGWRK